MGRRKREVHSWTDPKLALEACRLQLGAAVFAEAVETFQLAFGPIQPSEEGGQTGRLTAEERQTCAADVLYVLERNHRTLVTGGTAALLEIAAGVAGVRTADRFEAMRKAWDEALRRARKREFWAGPHVVDLSPQEMFETVAFLKTALVPPRRRRPTPDQVRGLVRTELALVERRLSQLDDKALRSLLRKLRALRRGPSAGKRNRPSN